MKVHTNAFKEQIKEMGRELDSLITFGNTELGAEQLNSVTPSFESSILKSAMKMLEVDSNVEIPKGSVVNYKFGVKVNGTYEYLDFGNYIVYSVEKEEDTLSYKVVCYDKMLNTMKSYTTLQNGTFPMSVRDYINNLCLDCGLTFKNASGEFANYDKIIKSDLYANLDYTYRDIFDELSAVTGSTICLDKEDRVEVRYVTDTLDTIDEEYLKDINVNFGEKYGPVNSIVLSRASESDNVYLQDESSVATNGLTELKIVDNQIMNFNDRADYLPDLLGKLNGLEYYINDFSSTGITYYEIGDRYNVLVGEKEYSCVMFNHEMLVTQGLEENVFTEMPEETETDYKHASKDDRKINQTYILAKKNEGKIEAVVKTVEETTSTVKDLENSVDYFSVDLSQYTLTIPTNSMQKPLETRNYDINYYGYYKGKQVVPNVSISGDNEGITTSTTSTYIRFAVDVNSIISNLTNNYTITFTYDSPSGAYTLTKKVSITLSIQGKDGTSVNILGSYNSLEELKQAHPTGNVGDAYIVQGDMYVWSTEENTWVDVGNIQGPAGTNGKDGEDGKSSYQIWLEQGNVGSEQDYLDSLKGKDGQNGQNGQDGKDGKDGINGTNGKDGKDGTNGSDGKSAYQIWLDAGNTGTEADYLESLKGKDGVDGKDGKDGTNGTNGTNGKDGTSTYFYVRYSANSNGNPMTQAPTTTTKYMGVASTTSPTAPTSYSAYTWSLIKGEDGKDGQDGKDGEQGIQGLPGADGTSSYLHIKYSDDGKTFTANNGETVGRYRGELVDNNPNDSLVFSDYTWYDMSLIVDEELEEIRQDVKQNTALIEETDEQIRLDVAENYTSKGTFDEFKQTTETELSIQSNELTISVSSIQERLDILGTNIDGTTGEVTSVKTGKGFTFNDEGLNINDPNAEFNTQITNTATQYKNGDEVITETSKDGFMTTDLKEKGTHQYSYNGDTYDFVAERIEVDGEYAYAHFYNGGDL
jgi:hypothetical protein